jgi:hypothetical protein
MPTRPKASFNQNPDVWMEYYDTISQMTEAQLAKCWEKTTQEEYTEMLEVLPPARWKGNAFLVGEPLTHSTEGVIYEAYARVNGRYYTRPALLQSFNPDQYEKQIHIQFQGE